ncbi:hypothetical protein SAMN05421858_0068 [Haladaptatus litoreus]|uniref:Uncharacterized protein n=1 Tax=Haladaptatus litoreus TaxID=553468 RepID=A0A1N6URL7_9EURY|nr:hypothetical protein [Haladaptatus litoreus]SIQ68280.1 hypothetical protein SAMN05421858_0068 [Haladaptatus litoreus]
MGDDRIIRRLNVVVVLLSVIAILLAMPYLLSVFDHLTRLLQAVAAALGTIGIFVLVQRYWTVWD